MDTQLLEEINKWNIAIAYLTTKVIKDLFPVSKKDFLESVENFQGAPGRFEKLDNEKNWYFSGAHNIQALRSTLDTVNTLSKKPAVIVFSLMKDKFNKEVAEALNNYEQKFYHQLDTERAASYAEIEKLIVAENMEENSYKSILKEFESSLVIFVGSFYFYSTVKRWVSNC